jgi:hypothetical protein
MPKSPDKILPGLFGVGKLIVHLVISLTENCFKSTFRNLRIHSLSLHDNE